MKDLKDQLVKLGAEHPDLREDLLAIITAVSAGPNDRPANAEVDKTSSVVLDTKYAQASLRELEMAAFVLMANICVHQTNSKLRSANNYSLVQVETVDGLGIELKVDLDQLSADAFGANWLRVEIRHTEKAMYIGARKIATIRKGDSIAKSGKYLGKVLASELMGL